MVSSGAELSLVVGDYVRFFYREFNRKGELEINEYSGQIQRVYGNRFVIAEANGMNPCRFEMVAVVK